MSESDKFKKIYETTRYYCSEFGIEVRIGKAVKAETLIGRLPVAIISAENPRSKKLSQMENSQRTHDLEILTSGRGLFYSHGENGEGKWREKSLWITGIEIETAEELMQRFDQNAIVFIDHSKIPRLIWNRNTEARSID